MAHRAGVRPAGTVGASLESQGACQGPILTWQPSCIADAEAAVSSGAAATAALLQHNQGADVVRRRRQAPARFACCPQRCAEPLTHRLQQQLAASEGIAAAQMHRLLLGMRQSTNA